MNSLCQTRDRPSAVVAAVRLCCSLLEPVAHEIAAMLLSHSSQKQLESSLRNSNVRNPINPAVVQASNRPQHRPTTVTCLATQQQPNGNGSWRSNLFNRSANGSSVSGSRSSSPLSSVLSSADELDLQLQQAAQFQLAFQEGTLGFGFSAGGLLFPVSVSDQWAAERCAYLNTTPSPWAVKQCVPSG